LAFRVLEKHLHQHERVTVAARADGARALAFHIGEKLPVISHLIAEDLTT
jgi:hypothetical protein